MVENNQGTCVHCNKPYSEVFADTTFCDRCKMVLEVDPSHEIESLKINNNMEQFKVFELDFGDTNLLSENANQITDWINTEVKDMKEGDELSYTITIRMMTRKEIEDLPEWS